MEKYDLTTKEQIVLHAFAQENSFYRRLWYFFKDNNFLTEKQYGHVEYLVKSLDYANTELAKAHLLV